MVRLGVYVPYFGVPVLFIEKLAILNERQLLEYGWNGVRTSQGYPKKARTLDVFVKFGQKTEFFPKAGAVINHIKSCHLMRSLDPFLKYDSKRGIICSIYG